MNSGEIKRTTVAIGELPPFYPTHLHKAEFWEHLGRVVASFGSLENVLARAIFAFTATRQFDESEIEDAFKKWLPLLERALSDPLGPLIDSYGRAVRDNQQSTIENSQDLIADLRSAAKLRNVFCHGFWQAPDASGRSVPFFVSNKQEIFETAVDIPYLLKAQEHVMQLACAVINSVTHTGSRFPGSLGPGKKVW